MSCQKSYKEKTIQFLIIQYFYSIFDSNKVALFSHSLPYNASLGGLDRIQNEALARVTELFVPYTKQQKLVTHVQYDILVEKMFSTNTYYIISIHFQLLISLEYDQIRINTQIGNLPLTLGGLKLHNAILKFLGNFKAALIINKMFIPLGYCF